VRNMYYIQKKALKQFADIVNSENRDNT